MLNWLIKLITHPKITEQFEIERKIFPPLYTRTFFLIANKKEKRLAILLTMLYLSLADIIMKLVLGLSNIIIFFDSPFLILIYSFFEITLLWNVLYLLLTKMMKFYHFLVKDSAEFLSSNKSRLLLLEAPKALELLESNRAEGWNLIIILNFENKDFDFIRHAFSDEKLVEHVFYKSGIAYEKFWLTRNANHLKKDPYATEYRCYFVKFVSLNRDKSFQSLEELTNLLLERVLLHSIPQISKGNYIRINESSWVHLEKSSGVKNDPSFSPPLMENDKQQIKNAIKIKVQKARISWEKWKDQDRQTFFLKMTNTKMKVPYCVSKKDIWADEQISKIKRLKNEKKL